MQFNHDDFVINRTIGKFNTGRGQFGVVNLAQYPKQPDLPPLALKQFNKSRIIRESLQRIIYNEMNILKSINHPFITTMYGTSQDQKHLYIVLEFVEGCDLYSRIRSMGNLTENVARFYASEILVALEYLHSFKIAFRDLKPENILINRQGHLKLTDFSFAKNVDDKTYTICGTPEYTAPEIIKKDGHDVSVDYWSLGVLIYEMIAGHPPFMDSSPMRIFNQVLEGKFTIPSNFSSELNDLIMKLLNPDPNYRLGAYNPVRDHPWFQDVDFQGVYNRSIKPPWRPWNFNDSQQFDRYQESDDEGIEDVHDELFLEF